MNLSVLEDSVKEMKEKQPEVSLEMKRTPAYACGESKGKELRDLELWKTLVVSRVESLARGNIALRLDVEKIEREQRAWSSVQGFGCSQGDSGRFGAFLSRIKGDRCGQKAVGSYC
ncbi:hypothetical protein Rs2_13567 [Raphanus sativus]|nr:hypothetical protein Rs2_13567 [Raphanus sativus]